MGDTSQSRSLQISPKYTVEDWRVLDLNADNPNQDEWLKAIDILRDRITGRFLKPAQKLIDVDKDGKPPTFGFAILALDCLVLETIQGFRDGLADHNGHSRRLFMEFLSAWPPFLKCLDEGMDANEKANAFYKQGRCALHHSGATENITVRITGPLMTFTGEKISVNRTVFHKELAVEFERYLAALADPQAIELRKKFLMKMNPICGV